MEYFIKRYKKDTGNDINENHLAIQKLCCAVERAKRALSDEDEVLVDVQSLFDGRDFSVTLTRAKFEGLNMVSFLNLKLTINFQFRVYLMKY